MSQLPVLGIIAVLSVSSDAMESGPLETVPLVMQSVLLGHPGGFPTGEGDPGSFVPDGWDSDGVLILGHIPIGDFPGNNSLANDCWGYVSPSGREYALIGLENGVAVVEITDPVHPVIVEFVLGPNSLWHDVKVIGDWAYAVSEGGSGIQVIDLREVDNGIVTSPGNVASGASHNIAANPDTGHLYRCGGGQTGLRIYEVNTDPASPRFVGAWNDYYVHDAQVVTWQRSGQWEGREIAFTLGGLDTGFTDTRLRIVDVTDPANPVILGSVAHPQRAYAHQGWLSEDQRYFYLNDELDERDFGFTTRTRVIDVEDLSNPVYTAEFTNGSRAIDHNCYTHNGLIFEANYRSGLRIFDATDPLAPVEVAYLDTFPADDLPEFDGAWSTYPYFPSGSVIISDMQQGLVIIRAIPNRLEFNFTLEIPEFFDPAGESFEFIVEEINSITLDPATVRLYIDQGDGAVEIPATALGDNTFAVLSGSLSCDSAATYWFSADSTTGETFSFPPLGEDDPGEAVVSSGQTIVFNDNFETDTGWTVQDFGGLTTGTWERAVPAGGGNRGDPPTDFDGSGRCYVTDNRNDEDIDGGSTILTSPAMDATGGDALLTYARWYSNTFGADPANDIFVIEISNDDGQSWIELETVGPTGGDVSGGWFAISLFVNDFFETPSANVRVRFNASDLDSASVVEAGVDAVAITIIECEDAGCRADIDGNGTLDADDFFAYLDLFAAGDDRADFDDDGDIDADDFFTFLDAFVAGCD